VQTCSLLVDTNSRRAAQSAADRARSQAAAAQLVKDKADAAALVKSNRKLQQERDLARAKTVRLEEDAAAAAALIDDSAVAHRDAQSATDGTRSQAATAQLVNDKADAAALVQGNRKLQQKRDLARAKVARLAEDAAAAAALVDDAALRDEVRELRAQLDDLFLENDDIRGRLSDLENDGGSEEAAVEESADVSAVDCSLREEVREARAQLNDLFLENDDIRDRLNDLENDADTEDAEEEGEAEKSADDYYRDPDASPASACSAAGDLPHVADPVCVVPVSACAATAYVLGSLATGAPIQWYARTCLFCPHDTFLLANFLGSGRTARLTNDLLLFDLDALMAVLRARTLPPLVSGLAAH
jgi:regulator of replication initiation timing